MCSRGRWLGLGYLRLILRQTHVLLLLQSQKSGNRTFQVLFLQASSAAPMSNFAVSSLNSFRNDTI